MNNTPNSSPSPSSPPFRRIVQIRNLNSNSSNRPPSSTRTTSSSSSSTGINNVNASSLPNLSNRNQNQINPSYMNGQLSRRPTMSSLHATSEPIPIVPPIPMQYRNSNPETPQLNNLSRSNPDRSNLDRRRHGMVIDNSPPSNSHGSSSSLRHSNSGLHGDEYLVGGRLEHMQQFTEQSRAHNVESNANLNRVESEDEDGEDEMIRDIINSLIQTPAVISTVDSGRSGLLAPYELNGLDLPQLRSELGTRINNWLELNLNFSNYADPHRAWQNGSIKQYDKKLINMDFLNKLNEADVRNFIKFFTDLTDIPDFHIDILGKKYKEQLATLTTLNPIKSRFFKSNKRFHKQELDIEQLKHKINSLRPIQQKFIERVVEIIRGISFNPNIIGHSKTIIANAVTSCSDNSLLGYIRLSRRISNYAAIKSELPSKIFPSLISYAMGEIAMKIIMDCTTEVVDKGRSINKAVDDVEVLLKFILTIFPKLKLKTYLGGVESMCYDNLAICITPKLTDSAYNFIKESITPENLLTYIEHLPEWNDIFEKFYPNKKLKFDGVNKKALDIQYRSLEKNPEDLAKIDKINAKAMQYKIEIITKIFISQGFSLID